MKVYERLASAFKAEGTSHVFGMMGDGNMYWMDALDKVGVKLFEVRHEGVGCGMADGWARATRTTGVCTATCGPGVPQLATALMTASRAGSPLVAFVGEAPIGDDEYIQKMDQEKFAAGVEAGYVRLMVPEKADEAVRKAFYLAKLESRPIMIGAPMDIQQQTWDDDDPYVPSPKLPISSSQAVQPDPDQLKKALDMVAASKKPVILVGRGAIWSGAGDAVIKLGNRIGALIATTLRAKNWLADTEYHVGISGHYTTRTVMQLFQDADCVIAVGAGLNRFTIMGDLLYPNARYVHIDAKPNVMMGGGRFADCYVQADARAGLEALESLLAKQSVKSTGYRTPDVKKSLLNHFADRTEYDIEPGCIDPREVCVALDEMIPTNINMIMGSGASNGFTTMLCNRPRPQVLAGQFFGCIGQMLPAAMGTVLATGNKPAFLVDGDASFIMHLSDFDTVMRYNMPLLCVVLNDQALGSEYHKMRAHKKDADLATIPSPDLGAIARAFGARGTLAHSIEEVRKAVAEWVAKPGPMIIDARISRNVITIPHRRILFGQDE